MLYRARLKPFDTADAEQDFRRHVENVHSAVEQGRGKRFSERFRWRYLLDVLRPSPKLHAKTIHLPDHGISPRFEGRHEKDADLVLTGTLRYQRQWHLQKARTYFWRYVGFQFAIVALASFDLFYSVFVGRTFWVIAGATAATLMFFAVRDFLDYGPLFRRYVKIAGNLREIEQAFERREEPFDLSDSRERLRIFVKSVEEALSSEFRHWYARH